MRRHESPASTSKPPPSVSMYVALPELPLESTLSRKVCPFHSSWSRRARLPEILARAQQPADAQDPMLLHGQALAGSSTCAFIYPHCRVYCRVEREESVREEEEDL